MNERASAPARFAAVLALALGVLVLLFVVVGSLSGGGDQDAPARGEKAAGARAGKPARRAYVVQNGDTLTSIARRTGVPVSRIQQLNPAVDPQILISGEKLKLR